MVEQRGSIVIGSWGSQWEIVQLFKVSRSPKRTCTQAYVLVHLIHEMMAD